MSVTTEEELVVERILDMLETELEVERAFMPSRDKRVWTKPYAEGFLDGLRHAVEAVKETEI